jgi:hypothetical protein
VVGLAVGIVTGLSASRSIVAQTRPRPRWAIGLQVAAAASRDALAAMATVALSTLLILGRWATTEDLQTS